MANIISILQGLLNWFTVRIGRYVEEGKTYTYLQQKTWNFIGTSDEVTIFLRNQKEFIPNDTCPGQIWLNAFRLRKSKKKDRGDGWALEVGRVDLAKSEYLPTNEIKIRVLLKSSKFRVFLKSSNIKALPTLAKWKYWVPDYLIVLKVEDKKF